MKLSTQRVLGFHTLDSAVKLSGLDCVLVSLTFGRRPVRCSEYDGWQSAIESREETDVAKGCVTQVNKAPDF